MGWLPVGYGWLWPLETPAPPLETPWRCASKPQVRRASKPLGTNFETKIFKFRWFLGPSDQNELYHTPLLSKIWDLGDKKFLVEDPFKMRRVLLKMIGMKTSIVAGNSWEAPGCWQEHERSGAISREAAAQSQKNPVSASAMLTGKFLQIRKVFATSSLLAEEFPVTLQYKISR